MGKDNNDWGNVHLDINERENQQYLENSEKINNRGSTILLDLYLAWTFNIGFIFKNSNI